MLRRQLQEFSQAFDKWQSSTCLAIKSAVAIALVITVAWNAGCDPVKETILPPKFVVQTVKTDHGVFTACWYVTIRNEGGPGSMLVQKWIGSSSNPNSRTVIYSQRLTLGTFESTTIKIEWSHGGLGALVNLAVYGPSDGIEFLPAAQ
jgi:hypothetical protein